MSPKYKLSYFAGKGLAEPIRWLLSYAGEEFEDIRFTRDEWPSIKPSMTPRSGTTRWSLLLRQTEQLDPAWYQDMCFHGGMVLGVLVGQSSSTMEIHTLRHIFKATPFGKIPILEFEGKRVSQSVAVSRYLGRQAGLGGNDAWEDLQIDIIIDTIGDYRQELSAFVREKDEQVKTEMKNKFLNETLPFYMNKFDTIAKENNSYLANGKLSWADIYFVAMSDVVSSFAGLDDVLAPYPNLSTLKDKIISIPKIKAWIDKRPVT